MDIITAVKVDVEKKHRKYYSTELIKDIIDAYNEHRCKDFE